MKEGNLQAPKRQPIPWQGEAFWDSEALEQELERVFDICHGCRRCVSLCDSFPTLFDLVDESSTMEVDSVAKSDYGKVVDQCYLCDLCAEIKCPYLPPHEWAVDFPHLMLRAKAQKFKAGQSKWRDRLITSTDKLLPLLSKPGIAQAGNVLGKSAGFRRVLEMMAGLHRKAPLPELQSRSARRRLAVAGKTSVQVQPTDETTGRVALFTTCYGDYIAPDLIRSFVSVFTHNAVEIILLSQEKCCGMPKLELGDLEAVACAKEVNMPYLLAAVEQGYDLIAPVPSCALMFRQEIPLLYPEEEEVARVASRFFDPFEYLMLRHKAGLLKTDFKQGLGEVAYHAACHQRAQRVGPKTREIFNLLADTKLTVIERCSGHDGTYALKKETYEKAVKIGAPVVRQIKKAGAEVCSSDCIMAGRMIAEGLGNAIPARHPMQLLQQAYGI